MIKKPDPAPKPLAYQMNFRGNMLIENELKVIGAY
jgi:hypothetical protein